MNRIDAISLFLGIQDIAHELIEWIENLSDEQFAEYCANAEYLPEEVHIKLRRFVELSGVVNESCADVEIAPPPSF